jgi:two-component system, OmpR family, heavy metal sensor histidine kinase CusS
MALSIRLRLSVWYLAVLCASLAVLGSVIFIGVQKSVATIVDGDLQDRLKAAKLFMAQQIPKELGKDLQDEFQEYSASQPGGELLQISDDSHSWIFQSPSIQKYNIAPPILAKPAGDGAQAGFQTIGSLRLIAGRTFLNGQSYYVQIATDVSKFNLLLQQLKWLLLISTPFAIAFALAGGYWLSGRALKPVKQITERARLIGAEELSLRLHVPKAADEMRLLAETLNDMLERIETSFHRITRFTADASHELRTPVAIIRTTAELALRHKRDEREYRQALLNILDEAERTGSLIDDLLSLARTDSPNPQVVMRSADLARIAENAYAKATHLAAQNKITLSLEINKREVYLDGDPEALSRMFLVLFDNAVKYSPVGSEVKAVFDVRGDRAVFEIRDSGIGITPDALPHIFERFYRADSVRTRSGGGFGLGLAIARAIANAHGADIQAESQDGKGSIFRISFTVFSQPRLEALPK